jgi:hypothetical protein
MVVVTVCFILSQRCACSSAQDGAVFSFVHLQLPSTGMYHDKMTLPSQHLPGKALLRSTALANGVSERLFGAHVR